MNIKPEIFKEYDVRGVFPADINEKIAYRIGGAFAKYLASEGFFGDIMIGRDVRISSPALASAARQGILDQGRNTIDIGIVTTPLFYYSVAKSRASGGLMVTASHNPPEYNGIKFVKSEAVPITLKGGIEVIKNLTLEDSDKKILPGKTIPMDFSEDYINFLANHASIKRTLQVSVDASNGSAGPLLGKLFAKIGVLLAPLNFEHDGNFPNHPPNPSLPEALVDLRNKIKGGGFDLGAILDADGDRVVFMDENGQAISSDIIAAWLASHLIGKGQKMILDYRSSHIVGEVVRERKGELILYKAGHTNIKRAMRDNNADFGAELSGHFYFKDFYFADSALLALIYVLSYLSGSVENMSEVVWQYKKYFHSGEINFEIKEKEKVIEKIQQEYADGEQNFRDGLTVNYPDWWFNLRPSNTEPLLRLVVEANTRAHLEEKRNELEGKIKASIA